MRFLADMGISLSTVAWLKQQGHDVLHLRDEGLQRATDPEVTAKALKEDRIILTFDLDFGTLLAFSKSKAPSLIILRLRDARPSNVNLLLGSALPIMKSHLADGAIITIEQERIRVRTLPI